MKVQERDIRSALRSLGNSPTAIARSLEALGIKGRKNTNWNCPLGVFLNRKFHATRGLDLLYEKGDYKNYSRPVDGFVRHFDDGDYPELIKY